jgi:hypothetical protein
MPPKRPFGWLAELAHQVHADRDLIGPARYTAYNFFFGLILIGVFAIILVEPGHASTATGAAIGALAILLCAGVPVARFRTAALERVLVAQGLALVALSVGLAAGSLVWALCAAAHTSFRYAPGMIFVPLVYGTLQVATFGGWGPGVNRRLRLAALFAGVACEIVVAVGVVIHLLRT